MHLFISSFLFTIKFIPIASQNIIIFIISTNRPIESWDTSKMLDMTYLFAYIADCNPNIGNWNVGKVTSFVSECIWYKLWKLYYACYWSDQYIWFLVIPWLSSILSLLFHAFHRLVCLRAQVPSIKTLVDGMCQVELILWVNGLNFCSMIYLKQFEVVDIFWSLLVIPWYSSILLLPYTCHSSECFMVQKPSTKTLVDGMCQVELILWVNGLNFCSMIYFKHIEVIGTFDFFLIHDSHLFCCCCFIHFIGWNVL
jgi:hypothetical protein